MFDDSLIFAIDCDEVLRRTLDTMINLYNEHFNDNKKRNDIHDFKVEKSFPEIEETTGVTASEWFFQEHSTELFLNAEPYSHVKDDIEALRTLGRVIIVTHQKSLQNKNETLLWLDKNGIEYDGICFVKDKTILKADYFVDDNDWNFVGSNAVHGILIDAPYNKDVNLVDQLLLNSNCETIDRCHNLHDFVTKLKKAFEDVKICKEKYPTGYRATYTLKRPIDYILRDNIKYQRTYGEAGDDVTLERLYVSGITPKAKVVLGSHRITINVNDLKKYI